MEFFKHLLSSSDFMPHGYCYMWRPGLVWLHVVSDSLIALAYFSIPFTLVYFIRKRRDVPFNWMFVCFGLFIFACGATHAMEVWTLWHANYWLSGSIKALTALASVPTALLLVHLVPQALALPSPEALRLEIAERTRAQEALDEVKSQLELAVHERTAELQKANQDLITENAQRARAQGELRQSEERFRSLVESVQDYAIFTLDPHGRVTSWNAGAERINGYRADEIIGHSVTRFYPPDDPEGATPEAALRTASTEGRFQGEGLRIRKDGSQFWADVVITALRDPQGILVGFSKITRDITERKHAEEEMRKLHSLVENSEDFIGVASLEGEVLFVNAAGQSAVGLSGSDQARRTKILDYVAEEDRERFKRDVLPAIFRDGRWKGETLFRNFNTGASIPMWQEIFFVTEEGSHRRLALATISRDITERKRVEASLQSARAQLAHMSRLTTMGGLMASIAHEVNQPLAAVVANGCACLRWLAQEPPNLERARDSVDRIVKEGNRAGQVIQRIRALSKRKDPQRTALDVNDVIQETFGLIEAELSGNHVSLSADLAPALPTVFADRVQLQQVILNLAMNGIESMRTVSERPRELAVGSRLAADNRVVVTIRDNGTGFSSDETEQFFEPFFTTKPQGTGMGLSISRNIVEAHGGDIRACANADHGATVEFLLPLAATAVA